MDRSFGRLVLIFVVITCVQGECYDIILLLYSTWLSLFWKFKISKVWTWTWISHCYPGRPSHLQKWNWWCQGLYIFWGVEVWRNWGKSIIILLSPTIGDILSNFLNFITNSPSQTHHDEEVARRFKRITTEDGLEEDDYIPQPQVKRNVFRNKKHIIDDALETQGNTFKRSVEEQELEEILHHGVKTIRSVDDDKKDGNNVEELQKKMLNNNNNNNNTVVDETMITKGMIQMSMKILKIQYQWFRDFWKNLFVNCKKSGEERRL